MTRENYGCGDNSCMFGPPGGMATNGGCSCLDEMPRTEDGRRQARRVRWGVQYLTAEVRRLQALLSGVPARAVTGISETGGGEA